MMEERPPIIVRRVRKGHHAHGGAWKVAFADFATAMMAFFLVLWLSEAATEDQKEAISGYFTDPIGFEQGGSPYVIDLEGSVTVTVTQDTAGKPQDQPEVRMREDTIQDLAAQLEQQKLTRLMQEIMTQIEKNPKLNAFKDQLLLDITDEGLRIQIVDKRQRPMFDSGRSELRPYFEEILFELAKSIAKVRNKISVSGHTDAQPFLGRDNYSNWELSADRANAARRALVEGGLPEGRMARVVGLASSVLYDEKDPYNPVNRRISILVLNKKTQEDIEGAEQADSAISTSDLLEELDRTLDRQGRKPEFDPDKDLPVDDKPAPNTDGLTW
ncbi:MULTISPECIES: flagellar motor protein MotB [unclassified Hahella]|uniref:flagellar motor protein MotB n=1 Tax=unclassified Hahella TaxID=2624107 RepID=UPI001C1EC675|nr:MULTISPECIES: flagellar motor protein MotB [unclassified Hahella]MBU6950059.1 flagellar motor protein MotB [Hahella sp. HN01]MDG9671127.1 flagellar motor protein MotB [Hahella sp. CR1]